LDIHNLERTVESRDASEWYAVSLNDDFIMTEKEGIVYMYGFRGDGHKYYPPAKGCHLERGVETEQQGRYTINYGVVESCQNYISFLYYPKENDTPYQHAIYASPNRLEKHGHIKKVFI